MPQDSDPFDWHPELRRLDAEFTEEFRAEAREYERLTALDHLRNRGLADVALELLHRGDVAAVEFPRRTFTGTVVYTATDLLCLRTRTAEVDVWLEAPLTLHVLERVRDGGASRSPGPGSFKARLCEHEASGNDVTIGRREHASEIRGRIRAVALDHLVVEAGSGPPCYVSSRTVDYVAVVRSSR